MAPIKLSNYPQLSLLCWTGPRKATLDPEVAFGVYEAYWRFIDHEALQPQESALIQSLADEYGNGLINA